MARALVVNGDDFGLTPGVNAGIVHAHARGILTSASLFANAAATDDAIAVARRTPTLGIGCHLALVDGTPLLPPSRIPTLAPDGVFRATWGGFLRAAVSGRIALDEVARELEAQIDRIRSAGIAPTHLDGHKHVHAYPPVFDVVARLARRFGIPVVRVPFEAPAVRLVVRFAGLPPAARQAAENLALGPWARHDRMLLMRYGLAPAPRFLGRALTGLFTTAFLRQLIDSVPEGVSELMTHPGYNDETLGRVRTRLRAERENEVALLTAPDAIEAVRRSGIALVRHADGTPASAGDLIETMAERPIAAGTE